jgi:hypothetical protein
MSDFELTPPSMPGKKKPGFLHRFFVKDEPIEAAPASAPASIPAPAPARSLPTQEELDEIKRKLGLDDEEELVSVPAPVPVPTPPAIPTAKVAVDSWTEDSAKIVPDTKTPWDKALEITQDDIIAERSVPSAPLIEAESPQTGATSSAPDADDDTHDGHLPAIHAPSSWDEELPDHHEAGMGGHDMGDIPQDHALAERTLPIHHEAIEEHLHEVTKAHDHIRRKIEKAAEAKEIPEWKHQDVEITPENYFILRNGQPIRSLAELREALEYIDDTTFAHHVNEYRNDFATWVRDIIGDAALAKEIEQSDDRPEMVRTLVNRERKIAEIIKKDQQKIERQVVQRKQAVKKLLGVEQEVATLQSRLVQKTHEIENDRKRAAKALKEKLDAEVARRLEKERKELQAAKQELAKAKHEHHEKKREHEESLAELTAREQSLTKREEIARKVEQDAKHARTILLQEKEDAKMLLKESAQLRKQWAEMKQLDAQTKSNLAAITTRETELSRREETFRQRERKHTNDLSKIHEERKLLDESREEHAKRKAELIRLEQDFTKMQRDAEARTKAALEEERGSRERLRSDQKKLDLLRSQIDKTLSKAIGQKKKVTSAIALRKHLEESMGILRKEVAEERKEMEEEEYHAMIEEKIATTPAGQPDRAEATEILDVNTNELPIYQKVAECKAALERGDLAKAKTLYNELRDEYVKVKMQPAERSTLYTSIRELYDDIHLAMLG